MISVVYSGSIHRCAGDGEGEEILGDHLVVVHHPLARDEVPEDVRVTAPPDDDAEDHDERANHQQLSGRDATEAIRAADITGKGTQCRAWRDRAARVSQIRGTAVLLLMWSSSPALRALGAGAVNDLPRSAAAAGVAPTSFDRLFDEEYARVAAIARRVLGDPDAAEDVAQEVFLDLHRRFGDNPGAQASAWARTAAVHTALNVIRANRRRTVREELYAPGPGTVNDPQVGGGDRRDQPGRALGACPYPEAHGDGARSPLQRPQLRGDGVGARHRRERGGNKIAARRGAPS